jgi:hypothetical protein
LACNEDGTYPEVSKFKGGYAEAGNSKPSQWLRGFMKADMAWFRNGWLDKIQVRSSDVGSMDLE